MEFPKEGDSNRSNGGLGNNLTEFKQALKSGIERMEAILQEAESTASNEAQQYEELRQRAEVKVGLLEAQLREMEESLRSKESAIKQLGENLTSKIQELEHRLTEKENLSCLLEKHNSEITILRSETEAKVGLLEAQLQEREETLRSKESAIRQLEESLTSKIQELEQSKCEDGVAYRSKTSNMRGASRIRTILSSMVRMIVPSGWDRLTEKENLSSLLEKQLRDYSSSIPDGGEGWPAGGSAPRNGGDPPQKESSNLQMEESFTAKIQEMEDQLNEKESLLEIRQADLNDLRTKLDFFGNAREGVVTLREEDVVTLNLPANK